MADVPVNGQSKEQTDRVVDISRVFHNEFVVWSKIYDEIEKGYNWLAGEQYDKSEIAWYDSQRRPTNVFNLIFPHVNTVLGDFLEADQREKVFPIGRSDPQIAATLEDVLDNIYFNNDMESMMAETLLAALVKMGWIYPRYSNEKDIEGSIVIKNVDEFEIMFDSRSKDYFLDDAAYLLRTRCMTTDQILNTWRNHRSKLQKMLIDRKSSKYWEGVEESISAMMCHKDYVMEVEGKYRIIEFHEMDYELTEVAYNPITRDRVIWDLEGRKADQWLKSNPDYKIVESHEKVKYITEVIPGLAFHLNHKKADLQDQTYDYIPLFAYHYGKKTIDNFGIFKNSFGPQREFNDWHNRTADIINKSSNPGQIMRPDLILNAREVGENYGSMPGLTIKLSPNAASLAEAWQRIEPAAFPQGTDVMQREAMDLLPKILGITPNQMGFSETKSEPAELFARRVRQATKALAVIYKNISRTKKRKSDKTLRLIQHYYDNERIVSVVVKEDMSTKDIFLNIQYGDKIINDVTVGKYEVVMDDLERNPTARAMRFELKTQLVNLIIQAFGPAAIDPEWWLKESDLGDVKVLIDRINFAIGTIMQSAQEEEAFGRADQLLTLANKRTGTPDKQSAPANNKKRVNTPQ